ncbi:MAG: hypothetical protein ACREFP_27445 [Acetobacteraceae bacterium]
MPNGQFRAPDFPGAASAALPVERSRASLAEHLVAVERLGERLLAGSESLERREAVVAADEAADLLSLAADALRAGLARLAALQGGDLSDELCDVAAAARADVPR